jgi:hypothetical protein
VTFRRVTNLELNIIKDEMGDWLQTSTVLWLGGGIVCPAVECTWGLMMLDTQKYTKQNHWCLSQVPLRFSCLLKRKK